jgi:hypothetical protein
VINDGQATAEEAISYIIRRAFGGQERSGMNIAGEALLI